MIRLTSLMEFQSTLSMRRATAVPFGQVIDT